jgi:uncharacterized protein with PhoU and TrkA domain
MTASRQKPILRRVLILFYFQGDYGIRVPEIAGSDLHRIGRGDLIGVTIIAVKRGKEVHVNPVPEFVFRPGDLVFLRGIRKACLKP